MTRFHYELGMTIIFVIYMIFIFSSIFRLNSLNFGIESCGPHLWKASNTKNASSWAFN